MEAGLTMAVTDLAAKHVVEVSKQNKGTAPTLHQVMVDLIAPASQRRLQAAIRTLAVRYQMTVGLNS